MFYKKRIVRPDTAADVAERIRYREVAAQISKEVTARYPRLTAENFDEAWAWKQARIEAIMNGEG